METTHFYLEGSNCIWSEKK